jgi:hypothetical protein
VSDIETLVAHAQSAGIDRVYAVGSVPGRPDYPYAVVSASRLPPDVRRLDGGGTTPKRFTAQIFGKNAESVEDLADLMLAAFDAAFIPDLDDSQCRAEVTTPPYRDPDDRGVLNVTHTYRY